LGPELSASDYQGEFALLVTPKNINNPLGRESQVSLLVGGNYDGPLAAEIEGRIVVLGDFKIGEKGLNSLGKFSINSPLKEYGQCRSLVLVELMTFFVTKVGVVLAVVSSLLKELSCKSVETSMETRTMDKLRQ